MHLLFSALTWDPQIRGALILLAAFLILPGSVYLILATNTGAKLGFVLAAAGLAGWIFVMAIVWAFYGIGLKGREKSWKVKEVITGDIRKSTTPDADQLPRGWKKLKKGSSILGDAQAFADKALIPEAPDLTEGAKPAEAPPRFTPPFKATTDYVAEAGYDKGGDNELFTVGRHKFFFRHSPHYAVIQVRPVLEQEGLGPGGVPPTPRPDPADPPVYVVMVRDLGSLRFPPFVVALSTGLIFAVCCYWLHVRDKEIMRLRSQPVPAGA